MWNTCLSLADYRESLAALTELELGLARQHAVAESLDLPTAVNTWTDLYSYSVFYDRTIAARDNSPWNSFLERLPGYGVAAFRQHFEPRLARDLQQAQAQIRRSRAGFWHEFHPEYFQGPDTGDWLTLHFRNCFAPDSPAQHPEDLKAGLRALVAHAQGERPEVSMVQCATWLNNVPFFLALFPDEWRAHAVICPYEPSAGWWGQMIDRQGKLHAGNAAYLREHGQFRYANLHGRCPLDRLVQHLNR